MDVFSRKAARPDAQRVARTAQTMHGLVWVYPWPPGGSAVSHVQVTAKVGSGLQDSQGE